MKNAKTVEMDGELVLQETTLSDGSKVYNIVCLGIEIECIDEQNAVALFSLIQKQNGIYTV